MDKKLINGIVEKIVEEYSKVDYVYDLTDSHNIDEIIRDNKLHEYINDQYNCGDDYDYDDYDDYDYDYDEEYDKLFYEIHDLIILQLETKGFIYDDVMEGYIKPNESCYYDSETNTYYKKT